MPKGESTGASATGLRVLAGCVRTLVREEQKLHPCYVHISFVLFGHVTAKPLRSPAEQIRCHRQNIPDGGNFTGFVTH